MLAKDVSDISLTTDMAFVQWHVHVSMAKLMGWLVETGKDKYALGPNLHYKLLYKTQQAGDYYKNVSNTELDRHDLWKIESDHLQLSQAINWRFVNLNVAFREVLGEPSSTFLVLLGPGGQQYHRGPAACHGARSGVPAPGRGVL